VEVDEVGLDDDEVAEGDDDSGPGVVGAVLGVPGTCG